MTRRRSSPLGLELVLSVVLALVVLPLLSHGAPVQESHADLQKYSEGCYYNYNHYSEGDRILTNEPCLNCTCHNKMLMCYLRVCPFTKPIGHDCTVEKREDQCCPIVTCPEVPVDIAHHSHQLSTSAPGTELSIPEKYGCSIDNKFYVEGAQVPSNPNKPCELCYCIRNRTACLMQECTLHIDGCQPIYNKGSCCPVRYNCDHENELLEIEDFSTTTTTVRPTQGYLLTSTTSPTVTTDCVHNNEVYADGASITGKNSCEHCYCMRGDIVCAVQECEMPTLESGSKTCRALPPAAGECCPSNYVCDDDRVTTEGGLTEDMLTTITPIIQSDLHESVSQEDVQLQEHIDDKIPVTELPEESVEGGQKDENIPTTISPITGEVPQPTEQGVKDSEVEEETPLSTTVTAVKETIFETTQSPIEHSTTHKTEEGFEPSHKDKEDESVHPPKEDEIINEEEEDATQAATTVSPVVGDIQNVESEEKEVLPTKISDTSPIEETTIYSTSDEGFNKEEGDTVPSKEEDDKPDQVESTTSSQETSEKDDVSTTSPIEIKKPEAEPENISSTTLAPIEESEDMDKISATEVSEKESPVTSAPSKEHIEPEEILPGETVEKDDDSTVSPIEISEPELESENVSSSTLSPVVESEDMNKIPATEVSPSSETPVIVTSVPSKSHIEPEETSSESVEFSEESAAGQGESEDKIDEDVSEPSSDSSTSSPIYETITESDNIHIGMPEIGDHKTESDLPQKKPKDEPEPIEEAVPTPSHVTEDEIPPVIIDSTTIHTVDTSTPTSDEADTNEHATTKSSILKEGEALDETTQGTFEEKPTKEDSEVIAVVEEVTEHTSKPLSVEIQDKKDNLPQTTALPIDTTNADEVSENQEKEEELSTESSGTEKRTTTSRPVRIHIGGEEESSEVTTKETEEEYADSTTSVPHIGDSDAAVTEREEGDSNISTDDTSSAPSVVESEKPDTEEVQIDSEQDTTMRAPSVSDSEVATAVETESKPDTAELSTATPPKVSESEHESATIVPLDLEATSDGEEEIKGQPESDIEDSTTVHPLTDESEEHIEDDQHKIQPEDDTTTGSTIVASEPAIDEEELEKKTEQSLIDSSTKHPSTSETEEATIEEDIIKGKPQYDSTETPAITDYEATSVVGVSAEKHPELVVDSTITPESKPEAELEDVENESNVDTNGEITTINPNVIDSEHPSAEKVDHKIPQHATPDATTVPSLPEEEKTNEEETNIDDRTTVRSEPDQDSSDSTTTTPPIADESESSEGTHKEHKTPAPEENIKQLPSEQGISDSTTVASSVDVSGEEVKEDDSGDLTTVSPFTSDSEGIIDEEIKKQPEQTLVDSSTKTPVATPDETSTTSDQEVKIQQTTTTPSLDVSEVSTSEEEEKDKDFEISEEGSSTKTTPLVDIDESIQTTDASPVPVSEEKQEIPIPATAVPQTTESEQPSKEDEAVQTTLRPIAHSDKESSESTEDSMPMHDIIPSAIPGEGDCLSNGNTFANNATVPTSNECELSCTCISSIIVCKKVECFEPPKPNNCVLDEASTDKCCPQYICGIDSFEKDQRPTTPEDVEDEEIQFTTTAPSHKHPHIPTESATSTQKPEEEHPVREHELTNTELPVFSDENTTPVSIDFVQPALTPEDPMSHVKADEEQEEQDENIVVAGSTTIQPITVKPTKQVTGDIEQSIEVTTSLPESQKPEVITTIVATDHEEEQKATTPTYEELPSTSDTVTKPKKTIIPAEEISTEGTIENEITTLQPIKSDASYEAPSVPSVTQTDDSTQSGEISETSDENSNESGEETDSEEDTKAPMLHKEEDQKMTTSRPLVSEHVGDIEPVDEITRIPEIDYNKPEMPEDLSHTKIEDETLLEKEKPAKPIGSVESETNQESEEFTEKTVTTPTSTILKPVEPSEDDSHNTSVEISDKKDDIPSLESAEDKPYEEKPVSSTITPIKSEEEQDSEEITESKKGETETQTMSSLPVSEEESGFEKDQTPSQTSAPVEEGKPITGTIIPEKESESSEEDISPSTSAPAMGEHSIEGSGAYISEEDSEDEKHDVISSTSTPTIDQTLAPVSSHESSEDEKDKIPSHTSAPVIDDHTPTEQNEYDIKNEENASQTSSPTIEEHSVEGSGAPISEDKSDVEQNEIASQTHVPAVDMQPTSDLEEENENDTTSSPAAEEHTVDGSDVPSLGDKSEQDEIISQTNAPAVDKKTSTSDLEDEMEINAPTSATVEEHSVEGSGAPISEDKTDIEQDEFINQTTASTIEKQPTISEVENKIDVTPSPAVEEESETPISEDKTDIELDELVSQTSSPATGKQPATSDNKEDNTIDTTTSPAIEEHTLEGSGVPTLEDKFEHDNVISQTNAPTIDKHPSNTDLEDEIKVHTPTSQNAEEHSVEGSGAPISEDKTDVEQEDNASQTTASTIEKQPISDSEEENKIDVTSSPSVEEGSGASDLEDKIDNEQDEIVSQTSSPNLNKQPSIPDMEDENKTDADSLLTGEEHSVEGSGSDTSEEEVAHKEPIDTPTRAPASEDEFIKVTVAPVSGDEVPSVTPIASTIAPVSATESEEVISNQTNAPSINVPSAGEESDEEKEDHTPVPSHDVNDKITPEIPSYQTTEKESNDSTSSSEEGQDTVSGTVAPVVGDKYEETELPEHKKPEVLVPISEDEKEFEFTTVSTDVHDESSDVSGAAAGSIPKEEVETSDEDIDATETPSKDTSSIVSGDQYVGATESSGVSTTDKTSDENILATDAPSKDTSIIASGDEFIGSTESAGITTPPKSIDEEKDSMEGDKTSSTISPIKTIDMEDFEATELPQVDFDKAQTSDEASSAEIEPASPVTVSTSKVDDEVFSQTQTPVSSDSDASEEEVSISQTEEESLDEKEHIDKTLLTTESSLPASETESPSFGTEVHPSEGQTDKPLTQTKQPELISVETSTKSKDESESTSATVMPDIMLSHEIIPQPGQPESDDQTLTEDIATDKPSADVIPAEIASAADGKKPSLEETQPTTYAPSVVDKTETSEHPETPETVEGESAEGTENKTPQPAHGQTETSASVSSEEDVSSEDIKPEDIDKFTTGKPVDNTVSTESQEEDIDSKPTTSKPAEEAAPTKSQEQDDVTISSTTSPVDQQPITLSPVGVHADSEHTDHTEESDEEKEHTEAPIDNTKVQAIGEFVTERAEEMTNEDKETISGQPITPQLSETVTSLPEGQEEQTKPEVSLTTESVLLSSEEIEEKTQLPEISTEIAAEDKKPQEQPSSSIEESEEKTQRPEIPSEIPQSPETGSVDDSEEKTQAPETQPEVLEEDHKQHIQPTEGAIASSTTDKPIVPTADDKIDSDLPKPIVTDDQPSAEDESPLSTTIHPLFPHIEHDRTTSTPQLNATDKVDHKIPESSSPSIPTTEQPTSQAITNAPTTQYQPPGYGQVPPQYPSYTEDEYTDEDETEVFGPGTCRYGGKLFVSAQQIPRDDPCDFCFCFRSDIICLQQSCPPPISGCHEEPISGFCCPRYECPVSMATTLNITTSTTTTSTTLPPHFLHHAYRGAAAKNGCHISGKSYKVGDKIDSASGPCMHCTCGGDGQMKCDPKTCSPEPMLRQMIAVVASRRR